MKALGALPLHAIVSRVDYTTGKTLYSLLYFLRWYVQILGNLLYTRHTYFAHWHAVCLCACVHTYDETESEIGHAEM